MEAKNMGLYFFYNRLQEAKGASVGSNAGNDEMNSITQPFCRLLLNFLNGWVTTQRFYIELGIGTTKLPNLLADIFNPFARQLLSYRTVYYMAISPAYNEQTPVGFHNKDILVKSVYLICFHEFCHGFGRVSCHSPPIMFVSFKRFSS